MHKAYLSTPDGHGAGRVQRRTARLILFNEQDRVLLIKIEDRTVFNPNKPISSSFWVTPGGALESSESFEQAARREIWDETGISRFELGPWVWTREHQLNWKGELIALHERFFTAHVKSAEIKLDNLTREEQAVYRTHKWWAVDEVRRSQETFIPDRLADRLTLLLAGNLPESPVFINE